MSSIQEVNPCTAHSLIQEGALLLDVRDAYEVADNAFDVPDIILIPLRDIEKRYREIPVNRQVIIACNSGHRSAMANRFLMKQGYGKSVNMKYGIVGWANEGLPLIRKQKQPLGAKLMRLFQNN